MNLSNAPGVRRLMSNEDIRELLEAARAEEREACLELLYKMAERARNDNQVGPFSMAFDAAAAIISERGQTGEGT